MFTGIVERSIPVASVADATGFTRLNLAVAWPDLKLGDSIAVNGCCLTVAELFPGLAAFDVVPETLAKTNLGMLRAGDLVHVERALRAGDRFDGHFVQGHVDGLARLVDRVATDEEWRLTLEPAPALAKYVVPKGSVALDGVSLTVAAVRGTTFEVAIIPTTLKLTTLGTRAVGWRFNFEADVISKTIVAQMERGQGEARGE